MQGFGVSRAAPAVLTAALVLLLAGCPENPGNGGPDGGDGGSPDAGTSPRYDVRALGTLGGATSEATAINNLGQVVGTAAAADGGLRAFLWNPDGGGMIDLEAPPCPGEARATAINDHGRIAGYWSCTDGGSRAFSWDNGQLMALDPLPGGTTSYAYGINDRGQIVGTSDVPDGSGTISHYRAAVLWSDGGVVLLPPKPTYHTIYTAAGINENGEIAGWEYYIGSSLNSTAVLWTGGKMEALPRGGTSQTIITGPQDQANAINDLGLIVGEYEQRPDGTPVSLAVIWENKQPRTLGGGKALAINNAGLIVGARKDRGTDRAQLWKDGAQRDLNELIAADGGWLLLRANGINEAGQIVGAGMLNGQTRAFLLTPR
jgi:probable HAF family extracellular repeat protein